MVSYLKNKRFLLSRIPSISDAFRSVVTATEAAIIADTSLNWGTLPKKVYFKQGTVKEITAILTGYTTAPFKDQKYPLVILVRDIREKVNKQLFGLGSSFKCRVLIVTITSPNLRADDRETQNFKPILLPIFEELIRQVSKSKLFGMPRINDMEIIKWDCYFYGTRENDKNIFNDYIDAIDIESITLNTKNIC